MRPLVKYLLTNCDDVHKVRDFFPAGLVIAVTGNGEAADGKAGRGETKFGVAGQAAHQGDVVYHVHFLHFIFGQTAEQGGRLLCADWFQVPVSVVLDVHDDTGAGLKTVDIVCFRREGNKFCLRVRKLFQKRQKLGRELLLQ